MSRSARLMCSLLALFVFVTVAETATAGGLFSRLRCRKKAACSRPCTQTTCCVATCDPAPCSTCGATDSDYCCKVTAAAQASRCYFKYGDNPRRLDKCLRITRLKYALCMRGKAPMPEVAVKAMPVAGPCDCSDECFGCDCEDEDCMLDCEEVCICRDICLECYKNGEYYECKLEEGDEGWDEFCENHYCDDCDAFCLKKLPAPETEAIPEPQPDAEAQ